MNLREFIAKLRRRYYRGPRVYEPIWTGRPRSPRHRLGERPATGYIYNGRTARREERL